MLKYSLVKLLPPALMPEGMSSHAAIGVEENMNHRGCCFLNFSIICESHIVGNGFLADLHTDGPVLAGNLSTLTN